MEPNTLFKVWTPDEVAECLEGLPDNLYSKIWNEIVPRFEARIEFRRCEDNPSGCNYPGEVDSNLSLSSFWDFFTEEEQKTLNRLSREFNRR